MGRSFAVPSLEWWLVGPACSQRHCQQGLQGHHHLEDHHRIVAAVEEGRRHIVPVVDRLDRRGRVVVVVDPKNKNDVSLSIYLEHARVNGRKH